MVWERVSEEEGDNVWWCWIDREKGFKIYVKQEDDSFCAELCKDQKTLDSIKTPCFSELIRWIRRRTGEVSIIYEIIDEYVEVLREDIKMLKEIWLDEARKRRELETLIKKSQMKR